MFLNIFIVIFTVISYLHWLCTLYMRTTLFIYQSKLSSFFPEWELLEAVEEICLGMKYDMIFFLFKDNAYFW